VEVNCATMNDTIRLPITAMTKMIAAIISRNHTFTLLLSWIKLRTATARKIKKTPIPTILLAGFENGGGGISNKIIIIYLIPYPFKITQ
jgi:hypothetical protein